MMIVTVHIIISELTAWITCSWAAKIPNTFIIAPIKAY